MSETVHKRIRTSHNNEKKNRKIPFKDKYQEDQDHDDSVIYLGQHRNSACHAHDDADKDDHDDHPYQHHQQPSFISAHFHPFVQSRKRNKKRRKSSQEHRMTRFQIVISSSHVLYIAVFLILGGIVCFVFAYLHLSSISSSSRHYSNAVWEEGDKSSRYSALREKYDQLLPFQDQTRIKRFVYEEMHEKKSLEHKRFKYKTLPSLRLSYDIYHCPTYPPVDYPMAWNITSVLQHWPILDPRTTHSSFSSSSSQRRSDAVHNTHQGHRPIRTPRDTETDKDTDPLVDTSSLFVPPLSLSNRSQSSQSNRPWITSFIHQSICIFDYELDLDKIQNYRTAEVPFLIRNDPRVLRTVERWNQPTYLKELLGGAHGMKYPVEYSTNPHFLFSQVQKKREKEGEKKQRNLLRKEKEYSHHGPMQTKEQEQKEFNDWKPTTKTVYMTFEDWLSHASRLHPANDSTTTLHLPRNNKSYSTTHNNSSSNNNNNNYEAKKYWYLRLLACGKGLGPNCPTKRSSEFLFDELPFFQYHSQDISTLKHSTLSYLVDPDSQKGIHCRFSMKGTISENHFDDSRNYIVSLGSGERRYILAHPNQCQNFYLFPKNHPSARQSMIEDWSKALQDSRTYPNFIRAKVNELVLTPGDVLYLPTDWFHYIISLDDMNIQCNTRSGRSDHYTRHLQHCGY